MNTAITNPRTNPALRQALIKLVSAISDDEINITNTVEQLPWADDQTIVTSGFIENCCRTLGVKGLISELDQCNMEGSGRAYAAYRAEEFVFVVEISYPDYHDDECDGSLERIYVCRDHDLSAVKAVIEERAADLERQIVSLRSKAADFAAMISKAIPAT